MTDSQDIKAPDAIRVMLADDHDLVRAAMRSLIASFHDIEIVTEVGRIADILPAVRQHHPNVLLLDLGFPEGNALDTAKTVIEDTPETKVLVFSMYADEKYVHDALTMGVSGYLLKQSASGELEVSIRAVAAGEIYLSPAVSRQVVSSYVNPDKSGDAGADKLTSRQNEILRYVALGMSSKQVARELDISVKTVEAHRAEIMRRLNVHDLSGLIRYAIRTGLINLTD